MPPVQEQPKTLKYWTIVQFVRDQVSQGFLAPGDRAPSLAEMQSRFGLSRATIEKAYTLLEQESVLVREQGRGTFVMTPPEKAGLVIALSAKLLHDSENPYWSNLLRGIQAAAREQRVEVLFPSFDDDSISKRVDGMIVSNEDVPFAETPADFPVVSLVSTQTETPCVRADDRSGVLLLTKHLIELGHRRIAFLSAYKKGSVVVNDRYQGYADGLEEAGIAYNETLVRYRPPQWEAREPHSVSGYQEMQKWLTEGFDASAIMVYNDSMAVGVIRAIQDAGLRVPEDISVTGFDGTPAFDYFHPHLTSARVPLFEIGKQGLDLLVQHLRGRAQLPQSLMLPVKIVAGESTAPPSPGQQ